MFPIMLMPSDYKMNGVVMNDFEKVREWIDNSEYDAEELFQMYFDECLPDDIPEYVIDGLEHDIELD